MWWPWRSLLHLIPATALRERCVTAWRQATLAAGWVPLYADEMQYWTWSRDLAVGYDTKPPMIACSVKSKL